MRLSKLCKILLLLSLCGCSTLKVRAVGPKIQLCVVQEMREGLECAMKDGTQVFLKWSEIKDKFLSGFNQQVIVPREDFVSLIEWAHKK